MPAESCVDALRLEAAASAARAHEAESQLARARTTICNAEAEAEAAKEALCVAEQQLRATEADTRAKVGQPAFPGRLVRPIPATLHWKAHGSGTRDGRPRAAAFLL